MTTKAAAKKSKSVPASKAAFKNAVKGKAKKEFVASKGYVVFSIMAMAAEFLIIIVLTMALTAAHREVKYTINENGEVVKVREDTPVRNGRIVSTDHVVGNESSKVVFIWYVDMQCPACAQMAPIVNALYQAYGDRVAFVTRYLVITGHDYAKPASLAVEAAANQGYYWEMMMSLFSQRSEWAFVNGNDLLEERIAKIFEDATGGKGNKNRFLLDWRSGSAQSKLEADERLVRDDGLNATPTVIIDGMQIDFVNSKVSTIELLAETIEKALGED